MPFFRHILGNIILISAVLSWLSAQGIKTILVLLNTKKFVAERIYGAGGMPSAHSAMVCALTMSVAHVCGLGSPEFAIAICFASVVIYDAMGVRRAAGEQAKILNRVVDIIEKDGEEVSGKELKEYLGHTPLEVLGGLLLGMTVALLMM